MSGVISAVVVGVVSAAASIAAAQSNRRSANQAQDEARRTALKNEKNAQEAQNRAYQRSPDTASILSAAQQASKGGASGTMLTGPLGVDPDALKLGKTSLLGS